MQSLSLQWSNFFGFVHYVTFYFICIIDRAVFHLFSELELKPEGKLTVTVIRANSLKNMEFVGKSDPYAVIQVRPLFKVKTKVVNNNLNPVWDQTFELIAEDKETQSLTIEVHFLSSIVPIVLISCLCFNPYKQFAWTL